MPASPLVLRCCWRRALANVDERPIQDQRACAVTHPRLHRYRQDYCYLPAKTYFAARPIKNTITAGTPRIMRGSITSLPCQFGLWVMSIQTPNPKTQSRLLRLTPSGFDLCAAHGALVDHNVLHERPADCYREQDEKHDENPLRDREPGHCRRPLTLAVTKDRRILARY